MDPRIIRSNKLKLTWGLISLIGPAALLIISLLVYALVNFVIGQTAAPSNSDLFGSQPAGAVAANIILFIVGAIGVVTLLPGIVVGIILLATRK